MYEVCQMGITKMILPHPNKSVIDWLYLSTEHLLQFREKIEKRCLIKMFWRSMYKRIRGRWFNSFEIYSLFLSRSHTSCIQTWFHLEWGIRIVFLDDNLLVLKFWATPVVFFTVKWMKFVHIKSNFICRSCFASFL